MNGSNRSYPEKWSFSPTLSLGYVFANKEDNRILNFGKLRFSAGIQHTDYVPIQGLWLENYNGSAGSYLTGLGDGSWQWGTFLGYQPTKRLTWKRPINSIGGLTCACSTGGCEL